MTKPMAKAFLSDLEIARAARMKPIDEVAAGLGIPDRHLYRYGPHKAKVSLEFIEGLRSRPDGRLIL
ncbi:MAG TPA: formate--tetrahydrofolate ligase, partial [Dongiaceae bacterium]|nr:formate--tetrahydrofolate ligase [Dongiaceae bacterium]